MRPNRIVVLILWLVAASFPVLAKQLAIVTNTANTTKDLTAEELIKIITLKTQSWPDGAAVTVVIHDPSTADMQLVLRRILNMNLEQAHAFIQAQQRLHCNCRF